MFLSELSLIPVQLFTYTDGLGGGIYCSLGENLAKIQENAHLFGRKPVDEHSGQEDTRRNEQTDWLVCQRV